MNQSWTFLPELTIFMLDCMTFFVNRWYCYRLPAICCTLYLVIDSVIYIWCTSQCFGWTKQLCHKRLVVHIVETVYNCRWENQQSLITKIMYLICLLPFRYLTIVIVMFCILTCTNINFYILPGIYSHITFVV